MAKALKPLIIVFLVLSIAALVLGIVLFLQRDVIKGRTQKLEKAVLDVTAELTSPKEPFVDAIDQTLDPAMLKVYASKTGGPTMDQQIKQMITIADIRKEQIFTTKETLKRTEDELAATKVELENTKTELANTKQELETTRTELATTRTELDTAKSQIAQLEQEKTQMQAQIDDLNTQLSKAGDEIQDLKDQVATLDKIVREYEGDKQNAKELAGVSGKIMLVDPDWNFVILDIGTNDKLYPEAIMIVHRGEQLIGKVRISSVQKNMAVAEIIRDWQKQVIHEGDNVIF